MKTKNYYLLIAILAISIFGQIGYAQPKDNTIEGKMKGVVELGAEGFNSFIITVDERKNWKLQKAEYGNSNVLEGLATEATVLEGLKKYIKGFVDFGVGSTDIHFVASSGSMIMGSTTLIVNALKTLGYVVNTVTPEEEGQLALVCVMPNTDKNSSYVIDVGSGNTKVSWMKGKEIITKSTYGSKYHLEFIDDNVVYKEAKELGSQVPKKYTKKAYIIGGVPYKFAKVSRKEKERYTTLDKLESYDLKNSKLNSGQRIIRGLRDGSGTGNFVFDWDSNFTIGFLLRLDY